MTETIVEAPQSIISFVEQREKYLKEKTIQFLVLSGFVSLFGAAYSVLTSDQSVIFRLGVASLNNPGIGYAISLVAFSLSQFALWFFAIWALVFPLFVSIYSYISSSKLESPVSTNSYKWFQLAISTFLPLALFSVLWTALPDFAQSNKLIAIDLNTIAAILVGSLLVAAAFFIINALVPKGMLQIKFALYSSTLYASILFSFGMQSDIFSYTALFGTLIYLMLDTKKLTSILSDVALYDLNAEISQKVRQIVVERDALVIAQSDVSLQHQKIENRKQEAEQEKTGQLLDQSLKMQEKARKIEENKRSQLEKIDNAIISQQQSRIDTVSRAIDVLSTEYSNRLIQEANAVVAEIEAGASGMDRQQLEKKLTELMETIGSQDHGVPEIAVNLRRIVGQTFQQQLDDLRDTGSSNHEVAFKELSETDQESIIHDLKSEQRITYKITYLKNLGFSKKNSWEILEEYCPEVKWTTFSFTWDKEIQLGE